MWVQELIWVKRNEHDVVVGMSEKLPPGTEDFVPTIPTKGGESNCQTSKKPV